MKQLQLTDQGETGGEDPVSLDSRRVPLERKVILKFHHFGGFFIEYSANVSLTGMFIKTEAPKLPWVPSSSSRSGWATSTGSFTDWVRLMWVRLEDDGPDRPPGMGIRYLKIDDESRSGGRTGHRRTRGEGRRGFRSGRCRRLLADCSSDEEARNERPGAGVGGDRVRSPPLEGDLLMIDEDLLGL